MSRIFLELFNLSIAASWLICAVLLIRLMFKKIAPKWVSCCLWALVAVRLIIPFSLESNLSLLPSDKVVNTDAVFSETVFPNDDYYQGDIPENDTPVDGEPEDNSGDLGNAGNENEYPDKENGNQAVPMPDNDKPAQALKPNRKPPQYIDTGIDIFDKPINNAIIGSMQDIPEENPVNPIKTLADKAWIIWIAGMVVMAVYAVINYVLLRRSVSTAIPDEGGIRRSEAVGSPFILGLFRPRIYLPFGLDNATEEQVIAHERAHLKRRDHWIKPFGFVLLTVYWFNPVIWLAYILLCRDIEMACDERVVKNMDAEARKAYATALLQCGVKHSRIAACPVAFGEIGVKQRVKNALNYKKPLFWIIIVSVIICVAVAIFFLTSPVNNDNTATDDEISADTSDNVSLEGDESDVSDLSDPETSKEPNNSKDPEGSITEPIELEYEVSVYNGEYMNPHGSEITNFAVIKNVQQLNEFLSEYTYNGTENDFRDTAQTLTEEFFLEKTLVIVPVCAPSGYEVYKVTYDGKSVIPYITDKTFEMNVVQSSLLIVEINNTDISENAVFKIIVEPSDEAPFVYGGGVSIKVNGGDEVSLNSDDAEAILALLNGSRWQDENCDCYSEYTVIVGRNELQYSSNGCFNDIQRKTSLQLSEDQIQSIKRLFPEISEPEVSEPEVSEPEVSEPEISKPEISEPEISEPEVSKPNDMLYEGNVYTYRVASVRHEHFDTEEKNLARIKELVNQLDWQDTHTDYDFDYCVIIGDGSKANKLYYNTDGFFSDETNDRFTTLTQAQTAELNAIFRNPLVFVGENVVEKKFTIAKNKLESPAFVEDFFFAYDESGEMFKVFWPDLEELEEDCVVNIKYGQTMPATYRYYSYLGYKPESAISALDVTVVSKPSPTKLASNRAVKYSEYNYWVVLNKEARLKMRVEDNKYGIKSQLYVINSMAELNDLRSCLALSDYGGASDFETATDHITEAYFHDKAIAVLYAWSPKLLAGYDVTDIRVAGKTMTINVTATPHDGYSPALIQDNFIVAEMNKEEISDCTTFKTNVTLKSLPEKTIDHTPRKVEFSANALEFKAYFPVFDNLYYYENESSYDGDPMFTITSHEQLENLHRIADYTNSDGTEELFNLSDDFFDNKALICIFAVSSSGGDELGITDIKVDNSGMVVDFEINHCGMTDDVYHALFYATVDKSVVNSCGDFRIDYTIIEPEW